MAAGVATARRDAAGAGAPVALLCPASGRRDSVGPTPTIPHIVSSVCQPTCPGSYCHQADAFAAQEAQLCDDKRRLKAHAREQEAGAELLIRQFRCGGWLGSGVWAGRGGGNDRRRW